VSPAEELLLLHLKLLVLPVKDGPFVRPTTYEPGTWAQGDCRMSEVQRSHSEVTLTRL
jgi:hypothetical protein